jgi:hypothetical protein
MKMLLNRDRCKGIIDRTEFPPPGPTAAVPVDLDKDGKPIPGTGAPGAAASTAFNDYTFRVWEPLRLISDFPVPRGEHSVELHEYRGSSRSLGCRQA